MGVIESQVAGAKCKGTQLQRQGGYGRHNKQQSQRSNQKSLTCTDLRHWFTVLLEIKREEAYQ